MRINSQERLHFYFFPIFENFDKYFFIWRFLKLNSSLIYENGQMCLKASGFNTLFSIFSEDKKVFWTTLSKREIMHLKKDSAKLMVSFCLMQAT